MLLANPCQGPPSRASPAPEREGGAGFGGTAAETSTTMLRFWAAQPPTAARQLRQTDVCQQYHSNARSRPPDRYRELRYWADQGKIFSDPDGWMLVLMNTPGFGVDVDSDAPATDHPVANPAYR
jgi:hypothetical protein